MTTLQRIMRRARVHRSTTATPKLSDLRAGGGSDVPLTALLHSQVAHRVVEQGELINEVALVGNPALLGTDLASVEAQEVCTVATCSQSACVAVLGTLGMVDTVREMAERRNAVQVCEHSLPGATSRTSYFRAGWEKDRGVHREH
jgi:hypothetical protein